MPRSLVIVAVFLVACGSHRTHATTPRPTTGSIAGLARDHDSGDPVAQAEVRVRVQGQLGEPTRTHSNRQGLYGFERLAPGRYDLTAEFAGQPIEVVNVVVRAGEATIVDLPFTLGRPDPVALDYFGDAKQSQIDHYRPRALSSAVAVVEGTVSDLGNKDRIAGAVVNVVGPGSGPQATTLQAVTDEQGRYRFETAPGTYVVSAYYTIGDHAQIEVRRSDIVVAGGEAVVVPLWIESAK